jgi:hypothetical protein
MRRAGIAAMFFLFSLFSVPGGAALAQGPAADWKTVETRHFRVHYPAPFEAWALHAAGEIESIHARVTAFVGYAPTRRIEVVVADPAADANGSAIPFLDRPEIVLWTSPPESESVIGDYGDWMELVTTHEIAHVAHLTRPSNHSAGILVLLSPAPFGPLAWKSPRWLTEGYATLVEGAVTGSGRPGSSFRAMLLRQLAIEGKLPEYGALDATGGWLGGAPAYLVGSAYLEWLSDREGRESLPRLWKRMASVRGGSFDFAFRAVFGESPKNLYDRFRADLTARAIAEEKRLAAAGLVSGELWQRLAGGTLAAEVSPDGTKLLVRRDPARGKSFLAVWSIAATEGERPKAETPIAAGPSKPGWTLPRANGHAAADPRWMSDGREVLFSRRGPDRTGVLRWDLYRWNIESGSVERVTCLGDAHDADPAPDGGSALAVSDRFGRSELVRVDLASGKVAPLAVTLPYPEPWPVWSHPRVSPDGKRIAALLHAGRRWRLVTLPAQGGEARDVALTGSPASAPAWSADGSRLFVTSDESGIWNVVAIGASGESAEETFTRVTGGAFAPAPTPDGKAVFFLELKASGVDIRRLALGAAVPPASGDAAAAYPLLPPSPVQTPPFSAEPASAPRPYDLWDRQAIRPLVNFSFAPSGNSAQLGLDSADVLGRLHLYALGSMGNAAGPRGGAGAAAYRGLPVAFSLQVFSAIEKPGNQGLAQRPAFDQERFGGFLEASWTRPFSWGRVDVRAGGGATHVEAFSEGNAFARELGSAGAGLVFRRTRGRSGFGFDLDAGGSLGATEGSSWTQWTAGARAVGILPVASLSAGARYGGTGGSPSLFDLFSIGGAPSAILAPGLDRNRILSPALPADLLAGERFEALRAELAGNAVPVALYAEWLRAWNGGSPKPDPIRVVGAEVRLERLIPAEFDRNVTFHAGVGWVFSEALRLNTATGYAQLIYRP